MESDEEEDWSRPLKDDFHTESRHAPRSDHNAGIVSKESSAHKRVIIHIDIDCFYAQVEMIRHPELRHKPLGIQQKYIIVTCNYPARERGLTKLMTVKDAKDKCPELILVYGEDLTNYRNMSYKISNYLQKYCPLVERLGFDENFLDVTELVNERILNQSESVQPQMTGHVFSSAGYDNETCACGCHKRLTVGSHIASEIRAGLADELGITCCAGVAHNKLLSKLVAGTHKPNQQTTLFPKQVPALLGQLASVQNIPGIGHTSARRLKELGIVSVHDLQHTDSSLLEEEFVLVAIETMKKLSMGIDDSPVVAFGLPQTLSDEDSFKKCSSTNDVQSKIKQLLNSLMNRLLEDGRAPHTLRLSIRRMSDTNRYGNRESRQCNIPASVWNRFSRDNVTHARDQLLNLTTSLFTKMVDVNKPFHLTLINVAFAKMEARSANDITAFFSPKVAAWNSEKTSEVKMSSDGTGSTKSSSLSSSSPSLSTLTSPQLLSTSSLQKKSCPSLNMRKTVKNIQASNSPDVGTVKSADMIEQKMDQFCQFPGDKLETQGLQSCVSPKSSRGHAKSFSDNVDGSIKTDFEIKDQSMHPDVHKCDSVRNINDANINKDIRTSFFARKSLEGGKTRLVSWLAKSPEKSVKHQHDRINEEIINTSDVQSKCTEPMYTTVPSVDYQTSAECSGNLKNTVKCEQSTKTKSKKRHWSECQLEDDENESMKGDKKMFHSTEDKNFGTNNSAEIRSLPGDVLPVDIDKEVFLELPSDIQKEIMDNCRQHITHSNPEVFQTQSKKCVRPGSTCKRNVNNCGSVFKLDEARESHCNNLKADLGFTCPANKDRTDNNDIINNMISAERNLDTESKRSKSLDSLNMFSSSDSSCKPLSDSDLETEKSRSSEWPSCSSQGHDLDSQHERSNEKIYEGVEAEGVDDIPGNIDRAVFVTLPAEIQRELVSEWKQSITKNRPSVSMLKSQTPSKGKNRNKHLKTLTKQASTNITVQSDQRSEQKKCFSDSKSRTESKPFFKMPKPSANNNILSYFSRK